MTVTPGYGRDYNTQKEVLLDWTSGKDFILASPCRGVENIGRICSIRDAKPGETISLRYRKNTRQAIYEMPGTEGD